MGISRPALTYTRTCTCSPVVLHCVPHLPVCCVCMTGCFFSRLPGRASQGVIFMYVPEVHYSQLTFSPQPSIIVSGSAHNVVCIKNSFRHTGRHHFCICTRASTGVQASIGVTRSYSSPLLSCALDSAYLCKTEGNTL